MQNNGMLYEAEALEARRLLSTDLNIDFPLGVFNASPSTAPLIRYTASGIQSDGKTIAAGNANFYLGNYYDYRQIAIVRFHPDGSRDKSFGKRGISLLSEPSVFIHDVAQTTDGKILLAGWQGSNPPDANSQPLLLRLNADGSLDATFVNPLLQALSSDDWNQINSLAVRSDGKVVIAGFDTQSRVRVQRLLADGSLDASFNKKHAPLDALNQYATGPKLVVQPDGKILVMCGSLARLNSDGSLDSSFASGGVARFGYEPWVGMALQANGQILLNSQYNGFDVERLNSDGSHDITFGNNGDVLIAGTQHDSNFAIAAGAKGRILALRPHGGGVIVTRLKPTGAVDRTYGSNGSAVLPDVLQGYGISAALPASNGDVLVGTDWIDNGSFTEQWTYFKLDANGNLKHDFVTGSVFSTQNIGESGTVIQLRRLPDDSILAAGVTVSPRGGHDFYLAKFRPDGSFDPSFAGGAGWTAIDFNEGDDQLTAIEVAPDGKIVLGGTSEGRFALSRFDADGTLDTTFGSAGRDTLTIGANGGVTAIAIQPDGKILFTGNNTNGLVLARLNTVGALDPSFNGTGMYLAAKSLWHADAYDIATQKTGRIIVAGELNNGFVVAGFRSDGLSDLHFAYHGVFTYKPESEGNALKQILIRADDSIVAAGFSKSSGAIIQLSKEGVLNTNLAGPGKSVMRIKNSSATIMPIDHLHVDPQGRLLLTDSYSQIARLNPDLSLDKPFAQNGIRTSIESDFHQFGAIDSVTLSTGRIVMSTSFQLGRGALFSFNAPAPTNPGQHLNSQGTLFIIATGGNDIVSIRRKGSNLYVSVNNIVTTYLRSQVKRTSVELLGGDDALRVSNGCGSVSVEGGSGNDTLQLGDGDDRIVGGDGDDSISPGYGNDSVSGGDGTNTLDYHERTSPMSIYLHSGNGGMDSGYEQTLLADDFQHVITGSGNDTINVDKPGIYNAGAGDDSLTSSGGAQLLGGEGNDHFNSNNFFADTVDGGPGVDSADVDHLDQVVRVENVTVGI